MLSEERPRVGTDLCRQLFGDLELSRHLRRRSAQLPATVRSRHVRRGGLGRAIRRSRLDRQGARRRRGGGGEPDAGPRAGRHRQDGPARGGRRPRTGTSARAAEGPRHRARARVPLRGRAPAVRASSRSRTARSAARGFPPALSCSCYCASPPGAPRGAARSSIPSGGWRAARRTARRNRWPSAPARRSAPAATSPPWRPKRPWRWSRATSRSNSISPLPPCGKSSASPCPHKACASCCVGARPGEARGNGWASRGWEARGAA
jgi:hypothetical protein